MKTRVQHVSNWHGNGFEIGVPSHVMEGSGARVCDVCHRVVVRGAGRWWEDNRFAVIWGFLSYQEDGRLVS